MTIDNFDDMSELVDAEIDRVDLVGKAANGHRFLLAKSDSANLLSADLVRDLIKSEEETMTNTESNEVAKEDLDATVVLAEPTEEVEGDATIPGSVAWEAIDAATAAKWTAILVRAKNAICTLADREMAELEAGVEYDDEGLDNLEDVLDAVDFAISTLAGFAAAEHGEMLYAEDTVNNIALIEKAVKGIKKTTLNTVEEYAPVVKAGRTLSAENESLLRAAAASIEKVLAALPAAPEAEVAKRVARLDAVAEALAANAAEELAKGLSAADATTLSDDDLARLAITGSDAERSIALQEIGLRALTSAQAAVAEEAAEHEAHEAAETAEEEVAEHADGEAVEADKSYGVVMSEAADEAQTVDTNEASTEEAESDEDAEAAAEAEETEADADELAVDAADEEDAAEEEKELDEEDGIITEPADMDTTPAAASSVGVPASITKREIGEERRAEMAEEGIALEDGSFPIATVGDLHNAISSYGRASHPEAVKAHIIDRARALGAVDELPEDWKVVKAHQVSDDKSEGTIDAKELIEAALKKEREETHALIKSLQDQIADLTAVAPSKVLANGALPQPQHMRGQDAGAPMNADVAQLRKQLETAGNIADREAIAEQLRLAALEALTRAHNGK
jgi:hypothetical protein